MLKKIAGVLLLLSVLSCTKTDNLGLETFTPKIEFYLASGNLDQDSISIDERFHTRFRPTPKLNQRDFDSIVFDYKNSVVIIRLTNMGKERLRDLAEKNAGRAIVIFFEKRIVTGFIIPNEIETDEIRIKMISDEQFREEVFKKY